MKKVHAKRSWIFFMVLALVLVLGKTPVFAATEVSDFAGLKAAVENGGEITLKQNITVTETLEIKNNVTISGDPKNRPKLILADGFSKDQMFKVPEGKSLTLNDIILDGKSKGRLINVKGGTVILKMADLQNGSTEPLKQNEKGDQNFSGGAILATKGEKQGSTVTIKGRVFVDNNTGSKALPKDRKCRRRRHQDRGFDAYDRRHVLYRQSLGWLGHRRRSPRGRHRSDANESKDRQRALYYFGTLQYRWRHKV